MPAKRRLLFVSHEMTLSGAPIQMAYLVRWLQVRGWEVAVVAPQDGPLVSKLPNVEILYEPELLIDPAYGALRRLTPQFDAVIANTIATWEAVQACQLERVPVIWYIHETQVGLQLMQLIHMIEPSLELADAIVTPSQITAHVYQQFRRREIDVVPYGIPPAPGTASPGKAATVSFAVVATYESRKGQDLFLDAIQQIDGAIGARARFRLAGRPLHSEFHAALCQRCAALDNVELLGALNHEQALGLLRGADVVVCSSRDETMPIVLLEAMSMRRAIVSFDVGGIREWICDGVNGLLVPPLDTAGLARAMERLVVDPQLRDTLGATGRATFDEHFTLDRFGARFAEVINRTIDNYAVAV